MYKYWCTGCGAETPQNGQIYCNTCRIQSSIKNSASVQSGNNSDITKKISELTNMLESIIAPQHGSKNRQLQALDNTLALVDLMVKYQTFSPRKKNNSK